MPKSKIALPAAHHIQDTKPARPKRDGARTRDAILRAAIDEFAEHGFSGARIERIVNRAVTNMRLVYFHFASKEELYFAVLEAVYADIRAQERALDLEALEPHEAIRRFIDFTITHFLNNPAFLKLTTYENLLGGRTVAGSDAIARMSSPLIATIRRILDRGRAAGLFRRDVDALQFYISIVALSCHHLNNVHTLSATFQADLAAPEWLAARAAHIREMLLSYLEWGNAR